MTEKLKLSGATPLNRSLPLLINETITNLLDEDQTEEITKLLKYLSELN